MVDIRAVDGDLAVRTPYDQAFMAAFKAEIPATDRRWSKENRYWLIGGRHGATIQRLIEQHFHRRVLIPVVASTQASPEMRLLDVRYIGLVRERDDGSHAAYAWCNATWSVVFPKSVLMGWFGRNERPDEASTFYSVLGIKQETAQEDVKKAWKRLARQWHPDVCREPDAAEQFRVIQEAYEVLSDTHRRAKYNAGLALERAYKAQDARLDAHRSSYRSPLRSGLILAFGHSTLGRFVVSKIVEWKDIVNEEGQILVSYWSDEFQLVQEKWVAP